MKICFCCNETKELDLFPTHKQMADGHLNKCKACIKEYSAEYYQNNKEHLKELSTLWIKNHPEQASESRKAWRKENPQIEEGIKYRQDNKGRISIRVNEWRKQNPDFKRVSSHNYRQRKRDQGGRLSRGLSEKLFKLQKGKCACCKLPLGDDYQMDHIIPLKLGGTNTDDNIQLLRAKCNAQKGAKHPIDFMNQRGFLL